MLPKSQTQRIMQFLIAKEAEGLAPRTLEFYRCKLKQAPDPLTRESIRSWLIELQTDHTPGGVHAFYRAVRAYCRWLEWEYDIPDPTDKIKPPKVPDEILDPAPQVWVDALVSACDSSWHGIRDRAIIMLLDATGIRAGELCLLSIDAVDMALSVIYVEHGKGGYPRAVDFDKRTKRALKAWIAIRFEMPAFFQSSYRNRLTYDTLRAIITRRSKDAGVDPMGLHAFRRKHALDLHRAGESLLTIQKRLGHHSDLVLKRYIKLSREDMIAAAARFHNRY